MTAVDPFVLLRQGGPDPATVADHDLADVRARFAQLTGLDVTDGADSIGLEVDDDHPVVVPLTPARPPQQPRPWRRRLAVVAVAAAAVVAVVAVVARPDDPGPDIATVPEVPGLLDDLAAAAGAQPPVPADWGQQYLRVARQQRVLNSFTGTSEVVPSLNESTVETWMARDGTWVELTDDVTITTEGTTPLDLSGGLPAGARTYPPGTLSTQLDAGQLATLPTGAAALAAVIDDLTPATGDRTLGGATTAAALLEQPAVPPAVRAALIGHIADLPPTTATSTSFRGRPAVAAVVSGPDRDLTLTFDAATGDLVDTRIVATSPIAAEAAEPGDLILQRTIDRRALVPELGDRP